MDHLGVALKVIEGARQCLLVFPLHAVLTGELVSHVQPQGGMGGHVGPSETHRMGQPRVNVMNEGVCQVTGLSEAPPVQLPGHVVLPILQEDGYPRPQ